MQYHIGVNCEPPTNIKKALSGERVVSAQEGSKSFGHKTQVVWRMEKNLFETFCFFLPKTRREKQKVTLSKNI